MLYYNIVANEFLVLEKKADCQGVGPGQSIQRIFRTKHEAYYSIVFIRMHRLHILNTVI
jgi:hypothetical protein